MTKPTLSVVLAVYNEEAVLAKCLESVKAIADEIVIVDGGSTDKTVNIAKKFKAKIIATTNKPNFHINKNMAIAAATKDWVLQLDADEVVSPELSAEILEKISTPSDANGYWMNRKNWFLKGFLTKGGQYPDPTLRLYRRGSGRLPERDVHEQASVKGKVDHLKHDLLHYRDTSFEKYLDGFNRYSTFLASQMHEAKVLPTALNGIKYLFFIPAKTFFSLYMRHRGYVDGRPGFIFALFSAFQPAVAYMKLWQKTYEK